MRHTNRLTYLLTLQTDRQTPRSSVTIVCISCIRCSLKIVEHRNTKNKKNDLFGREGIGISEWPVISKVIDKSLIRLATVFTADWSRLSWDHSLRARLNADDIRIQGSCRRESADQLQLAWIKYLTRRRQIACSSRTVINTNHLPSAAVRDGEDYMMPSATADSTGHCVAKLVYNTTYVWCRWSGKNSESTICAVLEQLSSVDSMATFDQS